MLTKITIKNFKRFEDVTVELGNPVVFIGPNNSGKSSALQALTLWDIGLKKFLEKTKGKQPPAKRPGVTVNRKDLISAPVPNTNLLWKDLHVRNVRNVKGKPLTTNIRIDIIVEGASDSGEIWKCGLEFDYANPESFYCRPLRKSDGNVMPIPSYASSVRLAYLPSMSGLVSNETRFDTGAINVRVGEGRTAEVLRNLCYRIYENNKSKWKILVELIESLFGSTLETPQYNSERGEISMGYKERGILLDISSSGRGLQQTLLLLAYMFANPGSILLLDEPDAHLEILRQRQIYEKLNLVALENNNQLIMASHSEVLLNEAADRDIVVAFVGSPHIVNDRGSQILKSLKEIGFEQYYQAEINGWCLYLEGSTDLSILQAFARKLNYQAAINALERPFVHYVGDKPNEVSRHYFGIKDAYPEFIGIAIFDRLEIELPENLGAKGLVWRKREIESYLCYPDVFELYAKMLGSEESIGSLFDRKTTETYVDSMKAAISEVTKAMETLGKGNPWDGNSKVSDDFLIPIFKSFFKKISSYNKFSKKNFHELAQFVPKEIIDPEIKEKLDVIVSIEKEASPRT